MKKVTLEIPVSVYEAMRFDERQVNGFLKYAGPAKVDFLPSLTNYIGKENLIRVKSETNKSVKSITVEFNNE